MRLRYLPALMVMALYLGATSAEASEKGRTAQDSQFSQATSDSEEAARDGRLPPPTPPKALGGSGGSTGSTGGESTGTAGTGGTGKLKPPPGVRKSDTSSDDDSATKPRPPSKKKKTKKKTTTKKEVEKEPTYGFGAKFGLMPYSAMSATMKDKTNRDYDMTMSYGLGLDGHYRLASRLYLTAELMYWWAEIEEYKGSTGSGDYNANSNDAILDLGIGAKFIFLGSERTSDRVYGRGYFGYSYYVSSDENNDAASGQVDDNRGGLYFGATAGILHKMGRSLSLFAEGGVLYRNFTNTGDVEKDAYLWSLQATAGFHYHWD